MYLQKIELMESGMKIIRTLLIMTLLMSLISCKTWWHKEDDDANSPYAGMTAKQLYTEGSKLLAKDEYSSSAKRFEAMESMYPFSAYAEKAQMSLLYAYYKNEDYPLAAASAERFIHLYPRAKNVDYAYYIKAMSNFQQNRGTFAKFLPMDESWRDSGTQAEAYSDFATLIQRFPDSQYKTNALQRMIYLRNMFAQRELNTAQYYYDHGRYVAAVERANYCIKNYAQAPSSQAALSIMYFANRKLGLKAAADDALKVYRDNYQTEPTLAKGNE